MKKLIALISLVFLAGCETNPVKPDIVEVKVPVPVKCEPAQVEKPVLPFDTSAKKNMTLRDKSKLLIAQDLRYKAYVKKLEAAVTKCERSIEEQVK